MPITSPPTPPNSGDPGPFNDRMDAMLGWFPGFVSEFNAELPRLAPRYLATRSGTANAIVLTAGYTSLTSGTQVRFRAASPNTGAATINLDGLGAIACRTITGAALPSGYIRTGTDTIATYDGSNWVLDRQIERGANANGEFMRLADGMQVITTPAITVDINIASGAVFRTPDQLVSLPASFSADPVGFGAVESTIFAWVNPRVRTTTAIFSCFAPGARTGEQVRVGAIGRWY